MAMINATHTTTLTGGVPFSEFALDAHEKTDAQIQNEIDAFDAEFAAKPETIDIPAMLVPSSVREN